VTGSVHNFYFFITEGQHIAVSDKHIRLNGNLSFGEIALCKALFWVKQVTCIIFMDNNLCTRCLSETVNAENVVKVSVGEKYVFYPDISDCFFECITAL
jgi:hypothetical protein